MNNVRYGYVTSNQAARQLGLSRQRVSVLIHQGRIPFKASGQRRLIKRSDLKKFASIERRPGCPPRSR
jgi:excisionase family DNA binding protein